MFFNKTCYSNGVRKNVKESEIVFTSN